MEREVSPAEAAEPGVSLIDVRTSEEWVEGHLPGAVHIPLPELQERAGEISNGPVVFYCRAGDRSSMAAEAFRASGREASSLAGGLDAWQADGRPLDS